MTESDGTLTTWEDITSIDARPGHPRPARSAIEEDRVALEAVVATRGETRRGYRPFPHPFPARMPFEVALAAVERFSRLGDVVLDPMSGSGVIARAAQSLGRKAVARDIDPLAVLLGRALCAPVDLSTLEQTLRLVMKRAERLVGTPSFKHTSTDDLCFEDRQFLAYWFPAEAVSQMFALAQAVTELPPGPVAVVSAAFVSSFVISCGAGASYARDLPRSRPHKVETNSPRLPFDQWQRRSREFIRYYATRGATEDAGDVRLGDARSLDLPDESVDTIITSPPYVNAIDYLRTSKFSLIFFGYDLAGLRTIRASAVGTEVGLPAGVMPPAMDRLVNEKVSDVRRRPLLRRYLLDMSMALHEAFRVLRPSGRALYVVGPSILRRNAYDGADVLSILARDAGFRVLGNARRDLSATNRSLPPPQRQQRGASIHNRMTCELYVILIKNTV